MIITSRAARLTGLAGAVILAATLTGCGTIESLFGGAQRDQDTNEVTEGGTESVFDIAEGDCLTEPDSTGEEVYDVEVVPCS